MHKEYPVPNMPTTKEPKVDGFVTNCLKASFPKNNDGEWDIFIILIVLCISTLVSPSNVSIIASIVMEVYNIPVKFQTHCIYVSKDMAFLKSWFFHTFCIVVGTL